MKSVTPVVSGKMSGLSNMLMTREEAQRHLTRVPLLVVMTPEGGLSASLSASLGQHCIRCTAQVRYLGKPCFLTLVGAGLAGPTDSSKEMQRGLSTTSVATDREIAAIVQFLELEQQVVNALEVSNHSIVLSDDLWIWPLHCSLVQEALLQLPALLMLPKGSSLAMPSTGQKRLNRLLFLFGIISWKSGVLDAIHGQFGQQTAFTFDLKRFYVQVLGALLPPCVIYLVIVGALNLDLHYNHDSWVISQLCMMAVMIVWTWLLAVCGHRRFQRQTKNIGHHPSAPTSRQHTFTDPFAVHSHAPTPTRQLTKPQKLVRILSLWLPLVVLYVFMVIIVNMLVVLLLIHVVYDWGDCKNPLLNPPYTEQVCRDPSVKHGFLGWLVELLCDLLLVVAFEGLLPVGHFFAERIAAHCGHRSVIERAVAIDSLDFLFAAFERLGFRLCLAFIFVPQWLSPSAEEICQWNDYLDVCSWQIVMAWRNTQKSDVINYEQRLNIFQKVMKGPFMVAPFIAILMKVVVPRVASGLYRAGSASRFLGRSIFFPVHWLSRLLALIFTYDGANVGCLHFMRHGWPFEGLSLTATEHSVFHDEPSEAGEQEKVVTRALSDFALKEFKNGDEVLDVKLVLLNVLLFGPVFPLGVIFTFVAQLVELRFSFLKLLYVRRRALPSKDRALRISFLRFVVGVTFTTLSWYTALVLITYQEDVHAWYPYNIIIPLVAILTGVVGLFAGNIAAELRRCVRHSSPID